MSDLQKAARHRASWIRTLRGIRTSLIENDADRYAMEQIIDRQLASMGAETVTERARRWHRFFDYYGAQLPTPAEYEAQERTAKPYKMTEADIERYWRY